jgi:hypothetical protein
MGTSSFMTTHDPKLLTCRACNASFRHRLVHGGFNESAHAYCELCGLTLIIHLPWQDPAYSRVQGFGIVTPRVERGLAPCPCGGRFSAAAAPRCPSCREALSATALTEQIESHAEGAKSGWRWQNSWQGLYAMVVEDRAVAIQLPTGA